MVRNYLGSQINHWHVSSPLHFISWSSPRTSHRLSYVPTMDVYYTCERCLTEVRGLEKNKCPRYVPNLVPQCTDVSDLRTAPRRVTGRGPGTTGLTSTTATEDVELKPPPSINLGKITSGHFLVNQFRGDQLTCVRFGRLFVWLVAFVVVDLERACVENQVRLQLR